MAERSSTVPRSSTRAPTFSSIGFRSALNDAPLLPLAVNWRVYLPGGKSSEKRSLSNRSQLRVRSSARVSAKTATSAVDRAAVQGVLGAGHPAGNVNEARRRFTSRKTANCGSALGSTGSSPSIFHCPVSDRNSTFTGSGRRSRR